MSTQVLRRKGTTLQHSTFVGGLAELTVDTDKDVAVIHDGVTAGGFPLAGTMFANIFTQTQSIQGGNLDVDGTGQFVVNEILLDATGLTVGDVSLTTPTFLGMDGSVVAANGEFNILAAGTVDVGGNFIVDVANPVNPQDAATKAYVDSVASAPPFTDTIALVKGSADPTKLMRFEVDGFTTATTRVLTPPNADIIIAGADFANAWADGVTQIFNPNGTSAGINVGAHTVDPSALNNGDIWYQSTANELRARINGATVALGAGGASPPFTDSSALIKGSVDPTKLMRFEVDGFTTATTRVLTPPNANITLAGINIAQTFAEDQTFGKRILLPNTTSATVGGIYFGGVIAVHNFGAYNFFAGVGAGNLTMTGVRNTAVGFESGPNITSGINNCFFGYDAGYLNAAGKGNSFFGFRAGNNNAAGEYNSFFGNRSGYANDANSNSFFGSGSGSTNTSGTNNVFVGFNAGYSNLTGANNSFFGAAAGFYGSLAVNNSFFGRNAGRSAGYGGVGGSYNCFFGFHAGYANTSGSNNVFFGHQAGDNVTDGSNNLLIGFNIDAANPSGVGQLSLGNLIFGTALDGTGTTVSSGNVGIAVVVPHSGLQVGRSFATPYRAITGTDTFSADDHTINATSGTLTLNLPTAVGITGRIYVAKNSGAGVVTLDADGGELIDGVTTQTINPGVSLTVQSTNAGWIII